MGYSIDRIFIAGYKYDLRYARCCVASARKWYPEIPITLIKDRFYGEYDTSDIEKYWEVDVLDVGNRVFSWGFSKFEPLFLKKRERVLILDADTVLLGSVLSLFEEHAEEFIVSGHSVSEGFQNRQYYDPKEISKYDSAFKHPGYAFNSGQMVVTTGIIKREDLEPFVAFTNPPVLKEENLFKYGDQGLFNYFLFKRQQEGVITLKSLPFMEGGESTFIKSLGCSELDNYENRPLVIHWAGVRGSRFSQTVGGHVLKYFEDCYYAKLPFGELTKYARIFGDEFSGSIKSVVKSALGK